MAHLHTTLSDAQVKQYLSWYNTGTITKPEALGYLGLKDSQFYKLLADFRRSPATFTVRYRRKTVNNRLDPAVVKAIRRELEAEQRLIANPAMPILFYNYAAIRDAVAERTGHAKLSAQTVVNYAKKWNFYIERPKNRQRHTREVVTDYIGMLLQHDASLHQWSPYAVLANGQPEKWSLITTLDDHSRLLVYAELFERESAWAHIQALESVVMNYGVGLQYYSDNHSIFRYVAHRDQNCRSAATYTRVLGTDDIAPQWKRCVEAAGMRITYALSPQAKGKIERPYRWLQDRIVRRAARENARTIDEVRAILRQEVERYNTRQVHSTTREIPALRFARAEREGRSCFRYFDAAYRASLMPPVASTKDIFCLRAERVVNGYGKVSLAGMQLTVPNCPEKGVVIQLHILPGDTVTEVRFLKNAAILGYQVIPTPSGLRF